MNEVVKFSDLRVGDIVEATYEYRGEPVIIRLNKGPQLACYSNLVIFRGRHLGELGELWLSERGFRRKLCKEEFFKIVMEL